MTRQIEAWEYLKTKVKKAAEAERAADKTLDDFVTEHLRDHPLSPEAIAELRAAVGAGKPLCCKDGAVFLAAVVDPIWAEHLNEWAYDALGCNKDRHIEDDLRRLNRFLLQPRER